MTVIAVYLGLARHNSAAAFLLLPPLLFGLTYVYCTRHSALCLGRALLVAVAVGVASSALLPVVLELGLLNPQGHFWFERTPLLWNVFTGAYIGVIWSSAAAFVVAVATVLIDAARGR